MRVSVFGMGYVGSVTAAVLAREGHQVMGIDTAPGKVETLARGESPVLEPGLPELIRQVHQTGRLTATTNAREGVEGAEVIFIAVGTPSAPNGAVDTTALERVATNIGAALATRGDYPVVVLRSTALPDVVEKVIVGALERGSGKRVGEHFGFAVNPEFLREGSAIQDFDNPEFTVLGTSEPRSSAVLQRLYAFLKAPVVVVDRPTAALVKYANNTFHALKVAFANEIASVADASGVNGREVMRLLCLDKRLNISPAYLRPGMPFGGSCLPKDVRAIGHHARRNDVDAPLIGAILESNRLQIQGCIDRILTHGRTRLGVFGMSFKAGTDDLRESPIVAIIEALLGKGLQIAIYDGRVSLARLVGANRAYVDEHLPHIASLLRGSLEEVLADSDVLVVGNGDAEFRRLPELKRPEQILIDLVGITQNAAPTEAPRRGNPAGARQVS